MSSNPMPCNFQSTTPLVIPDDFFVDTRNSDESFEFSQSKVPFVTSFALKALNYFNSKEQTDFEFVVDGQSDFGIYLIAKPILHINFVAQSPSSGLSSLFYAELQTTSLCPTDETVIEVFGCCMLRQLDSGNPKGYGCNCCDSETLIHPGPLSGYGIHKGDLFEGSLFWKYRSYTNLLRFDFGQIIERDNEFYTVCANKAIQLLNSRVMAGMAEPWVQLSLQVVGGDNVSHATLLDARLRSVYNWELLKVVAAMPRSGSAIHINFTVKSSDVTSPMLCFAEVNLPEEIYFADWTMDNEPFLEVIGCCIMKQVKSETQFGRLCGMCLDQLIHPGPAYGYCSIVGDDFDGKDFKRVGCGVF